MYLEIVLLIIGIGLLVKGSDLLVDAAEKLALAAGIPALIVGFTLVAAGTSVPELVVDTGAALSGVGELAAGDIVGANIVNICLGLGLAALVRPIHVQPSVMRLEVPITLAVALLFLLVSGDGTIGRRDGMLLIGAALIDFYLIIRQLKKTGHPSARLGPAGMKDALFLAIGLIAVLLGGWLTLDAAIGIAAAAGISPYLVGLTIVAIGTALPEIATGVTASRKGTGDLALGNILGSFSFNVLVIIGLCALIAPLPVRSLLDPIVMAAASILLVPLIMRRYVLSQLEGTLLVAFYLTYIAYKILTAGA